MGKQYYKLCICHSRDYAKKLNLPISKLCYADKAALLQLPNWFFKQQIWIGGEASEYHRTTKTKKWGFPINVFLIKKEYQKWLNSNFNMSEVQSEEKK
jgi:hypothetical protein